MLPSVSIQHDRPKMCKVTILSNGESFEVVLCETEEEFERLTIQDLWTKISETSEENYSPDDWTLNFRGRRLDDENSLLSEVGIKPRSVIDVKPQERHQIVFSRPCRRRSRPRRVMRLDSWEMELNSDRHTRHGSMDRLADFNIPDSSDLVPHQNNTNN